MLGEALELGAVLDVFSEDCPISKCSVGEVSFLEGWHVGSVSGRKLSVCFLWCCETECLVPLVFKVTTGTLGNYTTGFFKVKGAFWAKKFFIPSSRSPGCGLGGTRGRARCVLRSLRQHGTSHRSTHAPHPLCLCGCVPAPTRSRISPL